MFRCVSVLVYVLMCVACQGDGVGGCECVGVYVDVCAIVRV